MSDFFTSRVEGYDKHMLNDVPGCREGYARMAELLPDDAEALLDLGCGTGLELDEIFRKYPDIKVTGIDLTSAMLDKLGEKHPDRNLVLVHASYFDYDFGNEQFDTVISFQTMHHFSHEEKTGLYKRICQALKPGGKYIECDYMVLNQEEEDFYFTENARARKELDIAEEDFYHFDTPCTVDNQIMMFKKAGFEKSEMVWRLENTTIIVSEKKGEYKSDGKR